MDTNLNNLEFAVSQAVDRVLPDDDRRTLGDRLNGADAAAWAAEHERLNAVLRSHDPLPSIDFDGFAASIADRIDAEDAYALAPMPIRPTWTRRLAVAAAVALTGAAAWPFLPHLGKPAGPTGPAGHVFVQGPEISEATTTPVSQIAVGPSDTLVRRGMQLGLIADPTPAKPHVVISSAATPNDARPY